MHKKPQGGGKSLLVTMADRQPGDKGKGPHTLCNIAPLYKRSNDSIDVIFF